ncbi:aldehyde dehydrogenase family protein, partial [Pseudomonas sp.]|uniref:aldehyde dehydrogenase family protein n=1 Tax=Pseudomonas sp. TaxID=306 RepID=UPI0028AE1118
MQLNDSGLLRQQAYLNGEWCEADAGERTEILNPADASLVGSVPNMGGAETRRAILAAQAAQPAWRKLTAKERSLKLRRWGELMLENQEDLARLMTAEQGKPLAE